MSDKPAISVVIPCYNAAPFLRETLDSVLNQTRPVLEVIVVDDGSTDDSAAIAQSYGPPVHVIRQENQGESVARNRGMDEAQGDWVALLDADDRWVPNKIELQVAALQKADDDVICVYSDCVMFGSVKRKVMSYPMPPEKEVRWRTLTDPWMGLSTVIIRTDIGRKVRFPTCIRHGEERVFWFHYSSYGKFLHVPKPLFEYRKHPSQQTSQCDHVYRVIAVVWDWIESHSEELSTKEFRSTHKRLVEMLISCHDKAYWCKDWEIVEKVRRLYNYVLPDSHTLPPLFKRESPTWTMRAMYHTWNATLDILPLRLRQGLIRTSQGLVESLKRGRS